MSKKRIVVTDQGGVSVVRFVDRKIADSGNIEEMGTELTSLVTEEKRQFLLLNFEGVDFLSSAALNKLISLNNSAKKANGRLKLCNLRAEILEVFKLTRLDRLFDIRKSEEDAISSYKL